MRRTQQRRLYLLFLFLVGSTLSVLTLFLRSSTTPTSLRSHGSAYDDSADDVDPNSSTRIPLVVVVQAQLQKAFRSSGVQKVLELGVVAAIGALMADQIDAKATTGILLNTMVPAVVVSSLSAMQLSLETGLVLVAGLLLTLAQLLSGELAARLVLRKGRHQPKNHQTLQRTAALQLGTMSPALSVISFTREFVGVGFAGLTALADVATKVYVLLLIPYYLRVRGEQQPPTHSSSSSLPVVEKQEHTGSGKTLGKVPFTATRCLLGLVGDPFHVAITLGIALAALGKPLSTLGFFGKAIGGLAQAQTTLLFLLIGVKLKTSGGSKVCLRLLLARHGFCSLAVSAYLALFMSHMDVNYRLSAVLSSQASCSVIGFGQIVKATQAGVKGYDTELAFDIIAISFPFTVMLNTTACLLGGTYVTMLPLLGTSFLALSTALG